MIIMKMNKLETLFAKNSDYIRINLIKSDYSSSLIKLFVFADFAKEYSIPKALKNTTIRLITELENVEHVENLLHQLDLTNKDLIEYTLIGNAD